ncbi:MAG: methylmalonyl Co-A mutase-associated GTPase MeaB [Thermoplasmata archaeon]|nr:methylmalonyl Co-A mutase-associated GTPase MeaB [Thermoplasmata archaeon]
MTPRRTIPPLARGVLEKDRRALARLMTLVENHESAAAASMAAIYPHAGKAHIIGITGPLGVGKSSLISALLGHLRSKGRTVGIVAVDPSSPFSGGSVLGDRIRLDRTPGDDGVFIRSMASRGHAGGIAETTREVVRLLDAFGMDVILVETVGSGQVDVEIRDIASTSLVVVVPHLGDEVQSLKAGLFEIADVFCVNKGDLPGADGAARYLSEMVSLGTDRDGWRPRVVSASATAAQGISELWEALEAHERFLDEKKLRAGSERVRLGRELVELVRERVGDQLAQKIDDDPQLDRLLAQLQARTIDPHAAADRLFRAFRPET